MMRRMQPAVSGVLSRITSTLRATDRMFEGTDVNLESVREFTVKLSDCLTQVERLLPVLPPEQGTTLQRGLQQYIAILHEEEVKLMEMGGHNCQRQTPRTFSGSRGCPKYSITREQLEYFLDQGFSDTLMGKMLNVSTKTVQRRMREYDLRTGQRFCEISDQDLSDLVSRLVADNFNLGYRAVHGQLRSRGIRVPERRVRHALLSVNPIANVFRWGNAVQRRTYNVTTPNALWHIDGHHKLIRYKFVIHGGIDGFSRLVVFLKVSTNNQADTVLAAFREATAAYGVPSRCRMDHGGENEEVARFMEQVNGMNRGSAIKGRSVHNQRIERLWVDTYLCVASVFEKIFRQLEEKRLLDPDDDAQLFVLHHVYLPRIQAKLDIFRAQYNCHALSTENSRTPEQLWTMGALENLNSSNRGIVGIRTFPINNGEDVDGSYGIEEGPGVDEVDDQDNAPRVVVPPIRCPLTPYEMETLNSMHNNMDTDLTGIETYTSAFLFVANCLS